MGRTSSTTTRPTFGRSHVWVEGRDGLFPASDCIKVTGVYADTGQKMTIRGCALDSGTLTTDTEIIRMSHCGSFYFDDKYVKGCVVSCSDLDGCNSSTSLHQKSTFILSFLLLFLILSSTSLHLCSTPSWLSHLPITISSSSSFLSFT